MATAAADPTPVARHWLRVLALLAPLVLALAHWSGGLTLPLVRALDHLLDDARLLASLDGRPDPRIAIVAIDEASIAEVGRWPWSRDRLAALTRELLDRQGARVVGFNMVFAEPDPSEALQLMRQLAAGPLGQDARFMQQFDLLQPTLDHDAAFAAALSGPGRDTPAPPRGHPVLGFYLTAPNADSGAPPSSHARAGRLPASLFTLPTDAASGLQRWPDHAGNLPALAQAAPRAGFFNVLADDDGVVRAVPLVAEWAPPDGPRQVLPSFALAMLRAVLGDPQVVGVRPAGMAGQLGLSALRLADRAPAMAGTRSAPQPVASVITAEREHHAAINQIDFALDERGAVRVPYRRHEQFRFVPAADLLAARLPPNTLAGQVVLVAPTALGLADLRPTPLGTATPGVLIHASLLAGLLDGNLPLRPDWARGYEAFSVIAGCLVLAVLLPRLGALAALGSALLVLLGWLVAHALLYRQQGWVLPMALPLLAMATTTVLALVLGYAAEGRSRRALARLFGAYVPPELVDRMARDPDRYTRAGLSADNRELTILFCDLRDFTRTAERLAPEQLREVVNLFFSRMSAVVARHGGTLDKYIGDAVMAFWGAPLPMPDHAARAVRAAVEMTGELQVLNLELRNRGLPELGMGVGLNTGWVCVGDLGSDARRSYTVIGDPVNLAARIETLTRQFQVPVLAGEATWAAARAATADLPWRVVAHVPVKGREEGATVYTPCAAGSAVLPDASTGPKRESDRPVSTSTGDRPVGA